LDVRAGMAARWHGIINLSKPAGWTSHDVVAKVRRILGQREVGHAGTLDPMATGVLVLCAGQATRVAEYLTAHDKRYLAEIRLGVSTDTYDVEGRVVREAPVPPLSREHIAAALDRFVGEIDQVPPAYSAIKQGGVPAHRLARRGGEVVLAARRVTIHRIELLSWQSPELEAEVECGAGTYIRSLAHDLGEVLGCGAVLSALARTRSGPFPSTESVTLEQLAEAAASGHLPEHLLPLRLALEGLAQVTVDAEGATDLRHGRAVPGAPATEGAAGYAVDTAGNVIAIVSYSADQGVWRPRKVFTQEPTP
jgi:tRNA pseudouridine55 synthase